MKSQVVILLMGIALLQISLALAEGEEATTVAAGAEASAVNSTATDSSASVPPSPQEADGAAPPQREKEYLWIGCSGYECGTFDANAKSTDEYTEKTKFGKCIRIYRKDEDEADRNQPLVNCLDICGSSYGSLECRSNCINKHPRRSPTPHTCGLGGGAIAGIVIAVIILLVVAGAGLYYYLKKKQGVANPFGQLWQNLRQPAAAPPAPAPANPPPVPSKTKSNV